MARDTSDDTPILSRTDLVDEIDRGCKPKERWRIGTEHEKIGYRRGSNRPIAYDGPGGIRQLLDGMAGLLGWEPILDRGLPIGLVDPTHGGAISLEPGGQFELSGAPLSTLHQTATELQAHMMQVREISEPLGIAFLGLGASPLWSLAETPVMPKSRYAIMSDYMPKVGSRGLDMMYRTATVQVNLDFSSEADMRRKMRVSIALQPLATALFANSPYLDGRRTGRLSERSEIWRDTDNGRAGMIPFVFEDGFGFERYVDWAIDVPMYFVKRGETYHNATHVTFRQFMDGALAGEIDGVVPTIGDWNNHLGSLFPEVRLKRFLEMRGADSGSTRHILALPAFWVGLLYDSVALDEAEALIAGWTTADMQALRDAVPAEALRATIAGRPLLDLARDALAISRRGLLRRDLRSHCSGETEAIYLEPMEAVVADGRTEAERLLATFGDDIDRLFTDCEM